MCCDDKNLLDDDYDDDCYDFETIEEQEYVFFDDEEYDIDARWAQGWTINDEGFARGDATGYNDREYRCYPTRYRLKEFRLNKGLRRILKRNSDLKTVIRPFRPTEGKDALHTAHHHARFDKKHERYTVRTRFDYLKYAPVELMEACVFDGEKLIACSIFEVAEKSVYSSLAFWDLNEKHRGLGILTVLMEMQFARENGKEFYYLNHYVKQNPNFQYKTRFPALELWDWDNERWVDFKDERVREMLNHKFRCQDDLDKSEPEFTISLIEMVMQRTPQVIASAIFGSRAAGNAREDSDYDVLILTDDIEHFFIDDDLQKRFHRLRETKIERRGKFKILRAFYKNGDEFEFNFAPPALAKPESPDESLRHIVAGGIQILHDPQGILENLQKAVKTKGRKDGRK
jgi:arginyl-tRNA--protein-N-Asp/Glu arginylyltransferase/predicted nucleotidyltransferase